MIDDTLLQEYGLLGSFDTIVNMSGEQVAIKLQPVEETDEDDEEDDPMSSISFIELQDNSTLLSNQLKMRFGVKFGDYVLIITNGNTGAEITAMLSAMRLGAIFVPLSIQIEMNAVSGETRLQSIISQVVPTAAILVGADDNDPIVHYLAKLGVYKCALLTSRGILSADDPSAVVIVPSLPTSDDDSSGGGDNPLYLLFTSGSTGEPKGVLGTHRGLINRIAWQYRTYPYEFGEVAVRRTPLTFVDSLAEIFAPLLAGIPIVDYLMGPIQANGLASVIEEVSAAEVSRITLIPSQLLQTCRLLHSTTTQTQSEAWLSLRYIIVSGEECPGSLVNLFRIVFPHARLLNLYGSTEVAGDVTAALLYDGHTAIDTASIVAADSDKTSVQAVEQQQQQQAAAIGSAIDGNFLFLIQPLISENSQTPQFELVTDRTIPGELMVIGEHVALGYLQHSNSNNDNNPNLSSSNFLVNPFVMNPLLLSATVYDDTQKEKIFSYSNAFLTGDIVQWSDHKEYDAQPSSLVWLGRRDRVVKIRGNKVSLEEVERSAHVILGVDQVVVVFSLPHTNDQQLLVMIINHAQLQQQIQGSKNDIRQRLMQQLPELQRPHIILFLDEGFPHTSSMKIDRVALRQQVLTLLENQQASQTAESKGHVNESSDADTVVEDTLAKIISYLHDILPRRQSLSSMDANELKQVDFFSLGGDSISAIELLWRLRKAHPTVTIQQHILRLPLLQFATYLAYPLSYDKNSGREELNEQDAQPSKKVRKEQSSAPQLQISSGSFNTVITRGGFVNGSNTPSNSSSATLNLLWRYPLLKCIDSSPVICSGPHLSLTVIGCHGGRVVAIDTANGSMVWEVDIMEHIEAAVLVDLAHGLVFVVSYLGNDVDGFATANSTDAEDMLGAIRCLSLYTGAQVWMQRLKGECKATPALLTRSNVILVADYAGCMYKFNITDGRLVAKEKGLFTGSVFASPIVFDQERQVIFCTTKGWIVRVELEEQGGVGLYATESTIFTTPCVLSDDPSNPFSCIIALTDGSIRSYEWRPNVGMFMDVWRNNVSTAPFFSSPALIPAAFRYSSQKIEGRKMVIGCHDGFLRCIDTQSGAVLSAINLGTVIFGTPFVIHNSQHNLVVVATTAGDVVIANINEGRIVTRFQLPAEVFSSPVMDEQGRLLIGCRDDHVYCLQLTNAKL